MEHIKYGLVWVTILCISFNLVSRTLKEAEAKTKAEETSLLQHQFQIVLQSYHITRGSITSVTPLLAKRMCCDFSHVWSKLKNSACACSYVMHATRTCGAMLIVNWRLKLKKDLLRSPSTSTSSYVALQKFELWLKVELKNVVLGRCPALSKSNVESASTWNLLGIVHPKNFDSSSTWSRIWSWKKRGDPNAPYMSGTRLISSA